VQDKDEITDDGSAGMTHFGRSAWRRNLDDLLNPVMPVLLPPTQALLLQSTQVGHHHDFAGALGYNPIEMLGSPSK
jgi:hypothetical protein